MILRIAQKRSKQICWWPAGWILKYWSHVAAKKGDSPLVMMWWCSLCGRVSPDAALWAHVMVWWRLQLVTAVPSEPDNNNLLWRLRSKYNMYLIIHSITFCFYTVILSSSMSVFSSNDWDIHFQLLRFIHFDAIMIFYILSSIKRAVSVLDLTSHIHPNLIW